MQASNVSVYVSGTMKHPVTSNTSGKVKFPYHLKEMFTLDLDYTYSYARESALLEDGPRRTLSLVTSDGAGTGAALFDGAVAHPKRTADLLLAVVDVVQTRFHVPPAMLARILAQSDPVITVSRERIRFEGFSADCGVYARLDLLPEAVDGRRTGIGTTNVNFNAPVRTALSRIREGDPLAMTVASEGLTVRAGDNAVVERKVTLPSRWLRGFVDVQACQARMPPRLGVGGAEFRQFLHELPRGFKGIAWIVPARKGLRLSAVKQSGAVAAGGISRLRLLETVARYAVQVTIYAAPESAATGWTIDTPRFSSACCAKSRGMARVFR
jgi:hypothetical protein